MTRLVDRQGPVLADFGDPRLGFFVPPGTVARWVGTGVRGAGAGTWIVVPFPGRTGGGVRWLVPPDGSGTLTDPLLLELAMHEAAAGIAGTAGSIGGDGADGGGGSGGREDRGPGDLGLSVAGGAPSGRRAAGSIGAVGRQRS